ncbi:filamin A-interacting protein 1-like isoform X1 [Homalodisca vitripennis]|uniref:filamin A-interacting protein 1-like isoform X1 n=1 Tax=Homalodisca vitripennis TaxID=197043 RepID=UPI001EECC335|nr:filamin A-interacting protein 1-like isoform X1 [Homalodisca vitripennis]
MNSSKFTYTDMLTLRPEWDLAASVPRPKGANLPHGLPLWNKKPLNSKLPLLAGPSGPIVFTRGKLGEQLWKSAPGSHFRLSDPYSREVRFDYEPAHDKHLRNWLRRSDTLQTLRHQDLITPKLRVKCSVDQYNLYRQFLYNLYSDALRREAEERENSIVEKMMLKKAYHEAEKDAAKCKRFEDASAKRLSNLKNMDKLQAQRLENCKRRLQRIVDRAKDAEERKQEDLAQRKKRMEAFDKRIQKRITAANNLERKNKIKAMKAWHQQDVEKKRQFEQRKRNRELENKQKAEKRWKTKVEEQNKQIAKETFLREQRKQIKEKFQQDYMKRMQKKWIKMEEELNIRKCEGALAKVRGLREKSIKEIMHSVTEAYTTRRSLVRLSKDEGAMGTLKEHIEQILKEIRYDLEPYIVIAHAKARLERQENVPLPVSGAIKFLLEQSVVEWTAIQLTQTLETTAQKVLSAIDDIRLSPTTNENKSLSLKKSSVSMFHKKQSITSEKTARISQVEVIPVLKNVDELTVDVEQLRSTKDRPPTPMPSITTLTEVLFKEPNKEEFEEEDYSEFPFIEQKKLKITIGEVSNKIYRMIPTRVRTVVESRSYDRISTTSSDPADNLPENKPVAKLCSLILFEATVKDHVLTKIVDRIILNFMQDIDLTPSYLRLKIRQKLEAAKP